MAQSTLTLAVTVPRWRRVTAVAMLHVASCLARRAARIVTDGVRIETT